MPDPVVRKLGETFKKVTDGPASQKVLANFDLAYDYKDRVQLEKEIHAEYELIKEYLNKTSVKKEG